MFIACASFLRRKKGGQSPLRRPTTLLLGLMVYVDATWSETSFRSGKGKPYPPVKDITRNTARSTYRGGIHYKSGNFYRDDRDKGTRLQNMATLISHDDHDILSVRLNRFQIGERSWGMLGMDRMENA